MDFTLVTYDIPDDRRRNKVANILADYGQRVQFSVFEVWLSDRLRDELEDRLKQVIEAETDSIRLYRLCALCQTRVDTLGIGQTPQAPGVIII